MMDFAGQHLNHTLAVLLLLSRLGDIGTTYLITPSLKLEANPIVRKLGWRFALLSLVLCVVPYWSLELAAALLVPSLLVSASNAARVWPVRVMGEEEHSALLLRLARKSKVSHAVAGTLASSGFVMLAGFVVWLFYPSPASDWGFWLGLGMVAYGAVTGVYGTVWYARLFRRAREESSVVVDSGEAT